MRILYIFLLILFNISQYKCEIPSCKTNCTTSEECWKESLAYRSSELIEQLFSFSSLSVYVARYQQLHPNEVNDSILFIDKPLEDHLSDELINTNLTINLFSKTKQILIDFCKNITPTSTESISKLPPLTCSLSTCIADTMNFMMIFIISILLTSLILLMCIIQSFQTHHKARTSKLKEPRVVYNSFSISNPSINYNSNRF